MHSESQGAVSVTADGLSADGVGVGVGEVSGVVPGAEGSAAWAASEPVALDPGAAVAVLSARLSFTAPSTSVRLCPLVVGDACAEEASPGALLTACVPPLSGEAVAGESSRLSTNAVASTAQAAMPAAVTSSGFLRDRTETAAVSGGTDGVGAGSPAASGDGSTTGGAGWDTGAAGAAWQDI